MQCDLDFHVAKKRPVLHSNTGEPFLSQHFRTSRTTAPVVHPENEIQNNMVATQYFGELKVACGPAQLHLDHGQSQQNLHHQQESQARVVSTEFHHPIPEDSACTSQNSRHQINREGNAAFYSAAQVSAQQSSYFGTSANESSVRQSVNCEQLRSNLNNNTGLQRRRHLKCVSLSCTSSAAIQGVKEIFPVQDQCSSVTVCKKQTSSPLLVASLKGNPIDSKSFTILSFLSEETNGNTELNTIPDFSDVRHCKGQHGSQAALNCRQTRTKNLDHSGGTLSTSYQQQVSSLSLSSQPSTDKVLPGGEMEPYPDVHINDYIKGKLTYFMDVLAKKKGNYEHKAWDRNSTLQSDYTMPDSVSHLPTTSTSDKDVDKQSSKCAINEECTATVGQALGKDSSKDSNANAELMPKLKETDCCATYASMNSDITLLANGYCELVYSDDCDEHCSFTCRKAHSELDSPVDKILIHNIVSIPANQSEKLIDKTSGEGARKAASSMHSQSDLSIALNENKVKEHATQSETEGREAHPQYEDISDDDVLQLATTLPNTKHEELSFHTSIKDPHYEDISDADSPHNEYMTIETSQVPEPNDKRSPFQNECYGHVQGKAQMKKKLIPDEEAIPKQQISLKTIEIAWQCTHSCFIETDCCPKCNHETQTNPSASKCPSSETDDEIDYDCVLISVLDLKFEPEDEDQDSPETNVQEGGETGDQERQCDTSPTQTPPKPALAFDFPQLPVYDTKESFIQAMKCSFEVASGKSTPEHEMVSERVQNRRQSIDSCETEDSCDYSSASERNYLTVPRKMLKKRSTLRPSETDVSASENEGKEDEVTYLQKGQTRSMDCTQKLRQPIEAKAGCSEHVQPKTNGQQISKKFIIVVESDTEDESDHYYKKKTKRKRKEKKRRFSSDSEDSGDAPCSQQKRHLHRPVDRQCRIVTENFPENRPSADSPATLHQSNHDTSTEEMLQDACSDLSYSTRKSEQLPIPKAASEHFEGVITVDSDTEDDNNQKCKKPSRKRFFSSQSDSGDALYVEPETRLSSVDSSLSQRQSILNDTQLKDVMPDACSDLSHNRKKSGKLIEAKCSSAHVQHKANRQTSKRRVVFPDSVVKKSNFSKKKADKGILSGDSSDDLVATKDRHSTANEKPQKRLSSEDLPEQRPLSVDRETDFTLGPNPVIPRFLVKPSPPNTTLILLEEPRVHRQGREGSSQTSAASKKRICKMNREHLCRNKPTNDRHHAKISNAQSNVPKPRMDSRQIRQLSETSLSSASSRGLSPSEEASASSGLLTSKQTTFFPRQYLPLSKLQRLHSHDSSSTSSSATMPLSAKEQLNKDWKESFYPTKMDKKNCMRTEEDIEATNHSLREGSRGPQHHGKAPRQRHKSETPLSKKTKSDAIQRTKDINRDAPKERCPVGEGYKWSKKPTVAKSTKGSHREGKKYRSPPRPDQ